MVRVYLKGTQEDIDLAKFLNTTLNLKTIPRQGWIDKLKLKNPESVADHCFLVALAAMAISDKKKLNTEKVIRMSLLHDLAESIIGDITPQKMPRLAKKKLEKNAIEQILNYLGPALKNKYSKIWDEYQDNQTREAKLVHQIDKLEMAIQATRYAKGNPKKINSFIKSAKSGIHDADLSKILSQFL